MGAKNVIRNLESAINNLCIDIIEKKEKAEIDKVDALSKLVNSYSRLIVRKKETRAGRDRVSNDTFSQGDEINRAGIIR